MVQQARITAGWKIEKLPFLAAWLRCILLLIFDEVKVNNLVKFSRQILYPNFTINIAYIFVKTCPKIQYIFDKLNIIYIYFQLHFIFIYYHKVEFGYFLAERWLQFPK